MTQFENLKIEITEEGIAVIHLDRPPVNALSIGFAGQIRAAIMELSDNKDLRCIILASANPKGWCGGADVNDFKVSLPPGCNTPVGQSIMNILEQSPLPIIAAINGYCLGGGLELALSCDIRIVADNAKVGLPEANLSLIAAWGGITRLPWLIGEGNAKRLFYTADRVSGQEAYELGIAQKCVPVENLMDEAMALAKVIATKAPASIAGAKRVMYEARRTVFGASLLAEAQYCWSSRAHPEDLAEGGRAFAEKRTPNFKNR